MKLKKKRKIYKQFIVRCKDIFEDKFKIYLISNNANISIDIKFSLLKKSEINFNEIDLNINEIKAFIVCLINDEYTDIANKYDIDIFFPFDEEKIFKENILIIYYEGLKEGILNNGNGIR